MKIDVPGKFKLSVNGKIFDLELLMIVLAAVLMTGFLWALMVVFLLLGGC